MLGIYARTSRYVDDNGIKTIEQQIEAGKEFAEKHNLEYKIFADEGISGYKTDDDNDKDPYANRPQFLALMTAIVNGEIDKIWVWENSRLSRNTYTSAYIYQQLNKTNRKREKENKEPLELWIKDTKYNIQNPNDKLFKDLMDAFAEYERNLIVARTHRGLIKAINEGKRSFAKFYGYTKGKRNANGNFEYFVNEFELDNVKKAYEMIRQGKTLREISLSLIEDKPTELKGIIKISTKWGRILKHKEYTGFTLNEKGLEIEHKFEQGEIKTLNELRDVSKYWIESKVYTEKIISIEEWIPIREKLQVYKNIRASYKKNYSVDSSLATGLIVCNCCGLRYFIYKQKYDNKSKNKEIRLDYYKHSSLFNNTKCSQHPKTIRTVKIDFILGFFYFYYTLIFDTSNNRREKAIKEYKQQKRIFDVQLAENGKKLNSYNAIIKAVENAIEKDPENYLKHFDRLNKYEELKKEVELKIAESRENLTKIELQYSDSMAKKEFKKIFADWYKFYFKNSTENNRAEIIKLLVDNPEGTIKNGITIYSDYLVIQTDSKLFFVFKIDRNDKTLKPYQTLPIEDLLNNKEKFFNDFNEIWQRFQSGN